MTDSQPIDDDLLQMAGNPRLAEAIKESLHQLSAGKAGPDLADMARDLLAGRSTLREISRTEAYASYLNEGMAKFQQWRSELTPEERSELVNRVRDEFGPSAN